MTVCFDRQYFVIFKICFLIVTTKKIAEAGMHASGIGGTRTYVCAYVHKFVCINHCRYDQGCDIW